jgi:hypothetical protein
MKRTIIIGLVVLMACAAQVHADDPCLPNSAGITGEIDAKTEATIAALPARAWDQCKEMGAIAVAVAQARDGKVVQDTVAPQVWAWFTSLQKLNPNFTAGVAEVNKMYVAPIYQSTESWHDICDEYMNACYSK